MLKMLVASVQLALPLCLTIAILLASRAVVPARRRDVDRLTAVVAVIGLASAGLLAWLRLRTTVISIPAFNAVVGPIVIVLSITFLSVLWVMRDRPLLSSEPRVIHYLLTGSSLLAMLGLIVFYGFPYFFGMDGIVIMGNSIFDTDSLLRLAGYVFGTALIILVSWGYVRSAAKVPWYLRTGLTTVVFAALLLPRAILLYQQFAGQRLVPRNATVFSMVLWIQYNEATMQIALACLIALPGLFAWVLLGAPGPGLNPAEIRLHRAERISRRQFAGLAVAGSLGVLVTLTKGKEIAERVPELSPIEPSTLDGGSVLVSRSLVEDGHLHRFAYESTDGIQVRFLVIKKNEVAFGTGLDACEICGDSGYYEDDGKVICRACDVVMNIQTIGFKGGCNPIPIEYEQEPDNLRFSAEELESHAQIFK